MNLGVLNPLQPCNYAHKLYFLEFKLLLWNRFGTTTRLHQIIKKIYVLCIMLGTTHLWLSARHLRINLGTTCLTLIMNYSNLHKHNDVNNVRQLRWTIRKIKRRTITTQRFTWFGNVPTSTGASSLLLTINN